MSGETIISCVPDIGYLHRGVEKILESKKWLSIIPFLDRLDYLAPLHSEHAYVLSLEAALDLQVPQRALYIRTIFDELTRIASHMVAIGSATHDVGMLTPFLYSFEEREKILNIFDTLTGRRMHLSYYIPGGVISDITSKIIDRIAKFIEGIGWYTEAIKIMVLDSRIFQERTKGIGVISKNMAKQYCLTGPNARASGVCRDLRKDCPYAAYQYVNLDVLTLEEGDCYSRILIRFLEIDQSISIIKQCIEKLPGGKFHYSDILGKKVLDHPVKEAIYLYFYKNGIELPRRTKIYRSVENPRGEIGIFIATEEEQKKPYRLHIRSPSFANVQLLQGTLLKGSNISDLTAILGSLDFIMGDCDR
jgi:NADH-quinone oxidoreductase subunit D